MRLDLWREKGGEPLYRGRKKGFTHLHPDRIKGSEGKKKGKGKGKDRELRSFQRAHDEM